MNRSSPFFFVLLFTATAQAASGGTPLQLSHSGLVLDAGDTPLEGPQTLGFRIVDAVEGGNAEWVGTCAGLAVRAGYYAVVLGSADCLGSTANGLDPVLDTADLPVTEARWLEVVVNGIALAPRHLLAHAPIATEAAHALDADTLAGHAPGDFALAGHTHVAVDVTDFDTAAVEAASASGAFASATHTHALASALTDGPISAADWTSFTGAAAAVGAATHANTANTLVRRDASGSIGEVRLGTSGQPCTPENAGTFRFDGASFQGCTGTGWQTLGATGGLLGTPSNLQFVDVPSAPHGSQALSNVITLAGTNTSLLATVTGAGNPLLRIAGGAATASGMINPGQTLQVELTAASTATTARSATITVGGASTTWTVTSAATWRLLTAGAAFAARTSFAGAAGGGYLFAQGGYTTCCSGTNDGWRSADGVTWTPFNNAHWTGPQANAAAFVIGSTLFVEGGHTPGVSNSYVNAMFSSPVGSASFTAHGNAAWAARGAPGIVQVGSATWLLGGSAATQYTDVWATTNGTTWTQLTANAGFGRQGQGLAVLGSTVYATGGYASGSVFNDVWSSTNGSSWTRIVSNAPWSARYGHGMAPLNGRLWITGGLNASSTATSNDVWSSADGVNWVLETAAAPWPARYSHKLFAQGSGLVLYGGSNLSTIYNDVWAYP